MAQRNSDLHRVGRPRTTSQTHAAATATGAVIAPTLSVAATNPIVSTNTTESNSNTTAEVISATTPAVAAAEQIVASSTVVPTTTPSLAQTNIVGATQTAAAVMERSYTNDKRRSASNRAGNKKASRKSGRPPSMVTKDLGRWKPIDDLALIIGIQQTNDLRMVHRGIKFSCKFSLQELQTRWFSLLYDPSISRIAVAAMRNLHPELVESVQRKALYSNQEEELLASIKSVSLY